ncbi:MAG: helix-turn-helix transcriptional regulator [Clostridia bacterium]|nr:helix-turn-helix transcriptional regulator [Clostridia bacterium]
MYYNQIKKVRTEQGLTLLKLSNISGVSVGYLCHLEIGSRNNPSIEIMEKISKALGKTIMEIFFIQK